MRVSIRHIGLLLTLSAMLLTASACNTSVSGNPSDTSAGDTTVSTTGSSVADTTEPLTEDTSRADTTTEPIVTTEAESTTALPDSSSSVQTTGSVDTPDMPQYVNPLTGLATETDLSGQRPVAIMINNIRISCPQEGISEADIIYECLVEGGYTRLMMLSLDYTELPVVGSVRSSRDYYLDFAADYDAIYVHAGGSPYAYTSIKERSINNLDGVNMYLPTTFYRDQTRVKNMGLEHSLMTTGQKILEGIQYKRYRTLLTEDFDYPLDFSYSQVVSFEDAASHIHIPYSLVQITDFEYDAQTGRYLRYQFNGEKHIDGSTGEQLSFDNVLIYFCDTEMIDGDASYRITVGTVGEGVGYYATRGTYIPITWKKESHESPIRFFDEEGEPLLLNTGKTFVSVCPTSIENLVSFQYEG